MRSLSHSQPSGFTLMEMMAVMTIMVLVITAMSFSWTGKLSHASLNQTCRQLIRWDNQTRSHLCRRRQSGSLSIGIDDGRLAATRFIRGQSSSRKSKISKRIKILEIGSMSGVMNRGQFELPMSRAGFSDSYYIKLSSGPKIRWILFSGGTGQSEIFENEKEANARLEAIDAARVHAG